MKVTVFSSNQPRHLALVNKLADVCEEVNFISEANTVFPGTKQDFYSASQVMKQYFNGVQQAERDLFSQPSFTNPRVRTLVLKSGDLNLLDRMVLERALHADRFVVFGSSYIRGWLVEELVQKSALNIHMGLSPFYRGSSCNFWAMFDKRPEYVGATVHLLSKGLDSGPILKHIRPEYSGESPFLFTMKSVKAVQDFLIGGIQSGQIDMLKPVPQDPALEIRYSVNAEFTDEVASAFLERPLSSEEIESRLRTVKVSHLI
jgi:hypothetical protein